MYVNVECMMVFWVYVERGIEVKIDFLFLIKIIVEIKGGVQDYNNVINVF